MSAPAEVQGARWLLAPAVWSTNWIPEDDQHPWPELAEMRATHVRLRAASAEATQEVSRIELELAELYAMRQEALKEGHRTGKEPKLPKRQRERRRELKAELEAAQEQAQAVMQATVEFLDEATATITSRREQWLGELAAIEAQDQAAVAEARRKLAEAEARLGRTARLQHWVDRTGGSAAVLVQDHMVYTDIPIAAPQDDALSALTPERDGWIGNHMRESFSVSPDAPAPAAQEPEDEKEAMFDAALRDIERQEQDEIERGVRNA
jgi:hypothetical protein